MNKKILKISFVFFLLLAHKTVFAENGWSLQVDWPNSPTGSSLDATSTIAELVEYFFEWGIILGVVLTFGVLIYASFQYIISSGNPQKMSKAKSMLSSSFLGLTLLFGSWLLITILNPELAVISEVGISTPSPDPFEEWRDPEIQEETCDYSMISYTERGDSEDKITMINEGEARIIEMNPYNAIACKEKVGFNEDTINDQVQFVKARTESEEDDLRPICDIDCAQDSDKSCEDEIFIDADENLSKYCYDHRNFRSIKYVSQNPDSLGTSCLAGDKRLKDSGGCVVIIGETDLATGCGQRISDPGPVGDISDTYDKNVNCIEILRYSPYISE